MKKNKLCMVDLDGSLVFTRRANHLAYKRALNEQGYDCSLEYFARHCDGRSYKDFLPEIMGRDNPLIKTVHDRKIEIYPQCFFAAELNHALMDILRALKGEYYMALVTTASRENVENMLRHFSLMDFFDCVVTQEDVQRPKPDPMCYNMVMEKFSVSKENSIIFEDSPTGIAAARASGCQTFCIREERNES